jgi:putative ABC transport system permease protein
MHQLRALARGLGHRGGSTVLILVVALVAVAAVAAGPVYYDAARTSILQDTVAGAPVIGRGFEANETGPVASTLRPLQRTVNRLLDSDIGPKAAARLFAPPVQSIEGTGLYQPYGKEFILAWRTGACAHLRITGSCAAAPGQVIISQSLAARTGLRIGQRITGTGWSPLTVTGIYRLPDQNADYWVLRSTTYFPMETQPSSSRNATSNVELDAMFTPRATMDGAGNQQGTSVIDDQLAAGSLRAGDVPLLQSGMSAFATNVADQNVIIATEVPATLTTVQSSWRTVAVPVLLITLTLLALSWLLLFMAVTDAVDARGPEVALARLRGHGRWRTLAFGLSEPAALLAIAFPAGALAGWAAAAALDSLLLRPGTPTGMPLLAWAAAAVATAGGLAAIGLAARRTLRRGVVEEFRRAGRGAAERGWVVDAVLLTAAVAGLLDLLLTGQIGSASQNVLSLLVPALLGLAVAVVASRLLPLACRAVYGYTGRRGGLGTYLAVRQIARRPGGVRTTIVLATSFALATFAVTAWSVGRDNYRLVAGTQIGAPTVLTVAPPRGADLGAIVDHADPSGQQATVVDRYVSLTSGTGGDVTLGVDPQRFARIAYWSRRFAAQPLASLAGQLDPPAPPPITLTGDAMRITVQVASMSVPGELVSANVTTGSSPVSLGALPRRGAATLTGALVGCPCVLQSLELGLSGTELSGSSGRPAVSGDLTITSAAVHANGRWQPISPRALASAAAWKERNTTRHPPDVISAGPAGLRWSFSGVPGTEDPILQSADTPAVLPALIPATLTAGRTGIFAGVGLDGGPLLLRPVAAVGAVPGAPAGGVIVDRRYAELAAGQNLGQVTQEVWLAAGALGRIGPRLRAAGVSIVGEQSTAAMVASLERQGPALASVLFLADGGAAAVLAAGAAIMGIYLSARRRRYEFAALEGSGVRRPTLVRAVLIELMVVLGFGAVAGIGAGLAAAAAVLRSVPEFTTSPSAPSLSYVPPAGPLAIALGAAVGLLIIASVATGVTLIRGVRLDQLREAPA